LGKGKNHGTKEKIVIEGKEVEKNEKDVVKGKGENTNLGELHSLKLLGNMYADDSDDD
jgi:hypothetical protein